MYGYFNEDCVYHHEVHFSDIVLSSYVLLIFVIASFLYLCFPSRNNKFNWLGTWLPGICVLAIVPVWVTYRDYTVLMRAIGVSKAVMTLVCQVPQMLLIYQNKSTKGWSIWLVVTDILGGALALIQVVMDWISKVSY